MNTVALYAAIEAVGALEMLGLTILFGGVCAAVADAVTAIGFIANLKGDFFGWIFGWIFGGGLRGGGNGDCYYTVTYWCIYNMGWDEVCDNQRWAIDKVLGGHTIFETSADRPGGRNGGGKHFLNAHVSDSQFVNMGGNPIDRRSCDIIYDDSGPE
ncbi:hypothetical protein Cob_v011541 [Colletotrichum orbiculare MAFF 240422]|uniref:Uncharacterized protein n=1 Tax=Colletotrichum orbiculare (strain 104-T / ATCC 96160 / CBS 514.97 / LARS 414 / MAFF 240422) TaxID=1213857 RepID=N4V271_COLOR|nr:hypothetical protein Cob_v011541 [Colletotrichum orbiculare MAFF 240422]